jgi:hypothetical protein
MFTRLILAGTTLVLGLASCGGTPTVKAATPAEKSAITSNLQDITAKIQSLNLSVKAKNVTAQAVDGSVTVTCDTGSLTLSYAGNTSSPGTGTMSLKGASCGKGDVTLSDVNLNLKYNGDFLIEAGNVSFGFVYDGTMSYKDASQNLRVKYTNLRYDVNISSSTVGETTKYTSTVTLNGTVSVNDSFVTYENEVLKKTL